MDFLDELFNNYDTENATVTLTKAQFDAVINLISNRIDYRTKHFKEVKFAPKDSITIGYEQAAYGDWNYYIAPNGEFISTYYSIGD
jgi:hypothetical protein